ncbi:hypothetical protein BLNAU_24352 [Blattamonas nauphoetae]|uniref:Uncharacterized protein n=1 Tax=Blattamonas nauphoetae TaxID=2049346 RepID=A0ABQ9WMQ7_9EUKA|nr:hypothetical protein BLNAU_24352 [Blattamonas nauphoetae]
MCKLFDLIEEPRPFPKDEDDTHNQLTDTSQQARPSHKTSLPTAAESPSPAAETHSLHPSLQTLQSSRLLAQALAIALLLHN